ncbi:MAG: zonular occludens toxin domain-containing protein [Oscillospiraceae bacterium]
MALVFWIKEKLLFLIKLPFFLFWIGRDVYRAQFYHWKLKFECWGLHIYTGAFGSGKTSTMVFHAYEKACLYKQLTIVTNLKLSHFPAHTRILPLKSPQDILNAPKNSLVLIDEIGTIFNSRDFASSKESVPKILFQHLCQVRKRHMMIYATSQRWAFVDKQLRDITATVRPCKTKFRHPYCRYNSCHVFDAFEFDQAESNPMMKISPMGYYSNLQTDFRRSLYDTAELIESMLKSDYVSDEEIMRNRGETQSIFSVLSDGKKKPRVKKRA